MIAELYSMAYHPHSQRLYIAVTASIIITQIIAFRKNRDIPVIWTATDGRRIVIAVMQKGEPMDDPISRQMAIDEAKRLRDVAWANWKETKISANTMIDALKALPSAQPAQSNTLNALDCISRQAAVDAIKEWGLIDGLSEGQAVEILEDEGKVPSVQPEQRWIPCSERLPEKEGLYLVSGDSEIWICRFICLRFFRGWSNPANCPVVKAWMPLPEPARLEKDNG